MPQQPKMKMMREMKRMGPITDKEYKMFEKIDYEGDFDKEMSKYEKPRSQRSQKSRDMMRTSKPEVRETKQDMIRRKKKDLGMVGQITEGEMARIKRSMTAQERKMFNK